MSHLRILLILAIAFEGQSSAEVSRYPKGHYCRCSLDDSVDDRQCTRITFRVPKDGSRPIIDVTDEASGVKEKNVTYNTGEALSYDYYNIRLTNVELIRRLGPVEVDSISSLGTHKDSPDFLSPKLKEGRDTRFYRNELCREARSIEPVIPKALNIRSADSAPTTLTCRKGLTVLIGARRISPTSLSSWEASEMNARYDVDTSSLYGDGEKWDFAIELKEPGLVNTIGPGRVEILKAL
ncbi:hypothetical protein FOZ63_012351, partial [Perkinsus olseni]